MNDDKMIATTAASFLAGAVLGAGLALLLAPKSGRELRADISEATDSALEKIKETVSEGKALLSERASQLSDRLKKSEGAA